MSTQQWLLLALVFGAVVALVMAVTAVVGSAGAQRLRTRLLALRDVEGEDASGSVIRARYLRQLPPWERFLEQLPGMDVLTRMVEQAGRTIPGYRVAVIGLALGIVAGVAASVLAKSALIGLIVGGLATVLPVVKLRMDRAKRLARFEEQLPDALDLMSRSLRAGNPLLESFKFVAEEMHPPLSVDFDHAWSNINYGVSLKASLLDLLDRCPSVSLRAMVTAILVQRETGGNLAEVLDKIIGVLRARARFQRRLRALTAEGRMSAIVLITLPFGLAGLLAITSPTYLPMMFADPLGVKLVMTSLIMMALGIFWVSRAVKIRV